MKVLVTGGCGFIGSALIRHIIRNSTAHIVNVDNLTYAATPEALEDCSVNERYVHEQADIADEAAMERVFATHKPDGVIHLAAESHVDRSIDGPGIFVTTNVVGTYTLLNRSLAYWTDLSPEAGRRFRFHHVSTDEVYGSLSETDPAFSEETPSWPRSPYSASKAASDHLVQAWHETYGLPMVMTNCSNNYGLWQFPEKLIPVIILNAVQGKELPVYGKGDNIRDWLHVEDHAAALWQVFSQGRTGEKYNIGGDAERRNIDVVHTICDILDDIGATPGNGSCREQIKFVTDRPGHDHRYAIDTGKIRRELNWTPSFTFERGLEETVAWYLRNEPWWQDIHARKYDGKRLGVSI